jgi:peroxiredoxin Q/BCP
MLSILIIAAVVLIGGAAFLIAAPHKSSLKLGAKVANFSAPLSDGSTFQLNEWLVKAPLVLYFYPKDDTPGCTTEACSLRDDFSAFRNLKATVVGISYDTIESHKRFIDKYKLPFPLIADTNKNVATIFGVDGPLAAKRSTFILGKDGAVLYANPSVDPKTHTAEIRSVLEKLK